MPRPPRPPPARSETARSKLREVLADGQPVTLRELSALVGLSERDLPDHLEHLGKSLKAEGSRLEITPPECLGCGFVFVGRERFTRPGKCPECKGTRIAPPLVQLSS